MRKWFLAVVVSLALAGCAAQEEPIGVGGDTDEYKQSPCACGEPFYKNGQWVEG